MNEEEKILKSIERRKLSASELESILKAFENKSPRERAGFNDYFKHEEIIGVFSDPHIGSNEFDEPLFKHMVKQFKNRKVSRIYCVGDVLEGMSGREGQIYELSDIGFEQQMARAERLFRLLPVPTYGINGNHDMWYIKKNNGGVNPSQELERRIEQYTNLGDMEAEVNIGDNIRLLLYHGNDGTAYAVSYKLQKLMESFTGGEKPDVLLSGHYHKSLYMFNRNIHGMECGTLCGQTRWMRGRKIPAHKGFWVIRLNRGKGGMGLFEPTFYPGYK